MIGIVSPPPTMEYAFDAAIALDIFLVPLSNGVFST